MMSASMRRSLWYVYGNWRLSAPSSAGDCAYVGPTYAGSPAPVPSYTVIHFVGAYVSPKALSRASHGVPAAISSHDTTLPSDPGGQNVVPWLAPAMPTKATTLRRRSGCSRIVSRASVPPSEWPTSITRDEPVYRCTAVTKA